MIVLLDPKNQTVHLYTNNGLQEIPFDSVDELASVYKNARFLYVTKAVQTNAAAIIKLVRSLEPEPTQALPNTFYDQGVAPDKFFLRSTAPGPVHLAFLDLEFNGPGDCKEIDEQLRAALLSSVESQELIRQNQFEIIDERTMRRLTRKHSREQEQRQARIKNAKDRDLDSIIVKDRSAVDAADAGDDMFDGANDIDISDL